MKKEPDFLGGVFAFLIMFVVSAVGVGLWFGLMANAFNWMRNAI